MRSPTPTARLQDRRIQGEMVLVLFVAGAASAIIYYLLRPPAMIEGGGEMIAVANNIVVEGSFGNPFTTYRTGPTAALAPAYPAFLAVLIVIGGVSAPVLAVIFNVILAGLHAALLPHVSRSLIGGTAPGYCAGWLSVLLPVLPLAPAWEAGTAAVAGMAVVLAIRSLLSSGQLSASRPVAAGLCVGCLGLLNPAGSVIGFVFVFWVLKRRQITAMPLFRAAGLALSSAVLVCLPWLVRNHLRVGSFSLKNNFGMTFYASHNDCAAPSLVDTILSGCYDAHHPAGSNAEAGLMAQVGERNYNEIRQAAGFEWIRNNPTVSARLTLGRVIDFWFPTPTWHVYSYAAWLVTILAVPGLFVMLKNRTQGVGFILLVLLIYPLPYYLVVSDIRYRLPVIWLTLLLAGHWLAAANIPLRARSALNLISLAR